MTLQVSTSLPNGALTTPPSLTPATTDTVAAGSFGPNGLLCRIITTGTLTNFSIVDPNLTVMGSVATSASYATPATGSRMIPIPNSAVNQATQLCTLTFSSVTGVTYELYRY